MKFYIADITWYLNNAFVVFSIKNHSRNCTTIISQIVIFTPSPFALEITLAFSLFLSLSSTEIPRDLHFRRLRDEAGNASTFTRALINRKDRERKRVENEVRKNRRRIVLPRSLGERSRERETARTQTADARRTPRRRWRMSAWRARTSEIKIHGRRYRSKKGMLARKGAVLRSSFRREVYQTRCWSRSCRWTWPIIMLIESEKNRVLLCHKRQLRTMCLVRMKRGGIFRRKS